jgi:Holliday junction resolvase-like predicted endonuclease
LKDFPSYQGFVFERLVKDWIILKNKKAELDFSIRKIGSRMDRKNHEIDLIYTDEKEHIVFLECKLNEKRITSAECHQLQQNVELFLNKHPEWRDKQIKILFAVFDEKEIVKFIDSTSFS